MKIILSRKGFDSGYGKMPSPILPDGSLLPLPIPSSHDADTMAALDFRNAPFSDVLNDLSGSRFNLSSSIHYDPQLAQPLGSGFDLTDWRPTLGQSGAAQSHLAKEGVCAGDVFLFFGWFRQADVVAGKWKYMREAPNRHVIFGWLEVEHVFPIVLERERCLSEHPWIASHPHAFSPDRYTDPRNTIYVGRKESAFVSGRRGGGNFKRFSPSLRLTKAGETRRMWELPAWMHPGPGQRPLTYHGGQHRWQAGADCSILQSVDKGQEFVLHCADYPDAADWVRHLICSNGAI